MLDDENKKEQPIEPEVVSEDEPVYQKYQKEREEEQTQKETTPLEKVNKLANRMPGNILAIISFVFACISLTFVNVTFAFYAGQNWVIYLVLLVLNVFVLPLPIVGLVFANKSIKLSRIPYRVFARIAKPINLVSLVFIVVDVFVYLILFIAFLIASL